MITDHLELITLPPPTAPVIDEGLDEASHETLDGLWRIVIHNDDITTFEFVIFVLETIFMLSSEMAEHIAFTAHEKGQAVVMIRPRPEAERLVDLAHTRARLDGYPLTFTIEPED